MTVIEAVLEEIQPGYCRFGFTAKGHAKGSIEACAGVSALMEALHCYLLNAKNVIHDIEIETNQDGFYRIVFEGDDTAFTAYMVILSGLLSIEAGYPEYVRVKRTIVEK